MQSVWKMVVVGLVAVAAGGCAANYYNVPRENYEKKVRVLGVAPLLVDADSDIRHPEREGLLSLVREANRKNEKELVSLVKDGGDYFSVRLLEENPEQLFAGMVARRERRDDAGVVYNKYFYKPEELRSLVTRNSLDAVMVVTVSGLTRRDKVYSSNYMAFLEGDYNYLTMTAQILDADGNVLWEYPNFRQRLLSYPLFLPLQYPDFDEGRANETDKLEVRFKTIPGIGRAFAKKEQSSVNKSAEVAVLYNAQFEAMAALLQSVRGPFGGSGAVEKKEPAKGGEGKQETARQESR